MNGDFLKETAQKPGKEKASVRRKDWVKGEPAMEQKSSNLSPGIPKRPKMVNISCKKPGAGTNAKRFTVP
jgi:hypothetical protein